MSTTGSITQCTNCNGELKFNPAEQTLDCPFCNSTYTLKGEAIKAELQINETPQLIIPFAFAKEVFDKSAMEWLSQGDYTPADILDGYSSNSSKGIYVPLYIWGIDYIVIAPAGNKPGYTMAVANSDVTKNWPSEINQFAKSLVISKGHSKPFDKIYTLGFDVLEDDVVDTDSFNKKAHVFAVESVIKANNLTDSKTVVINKMELTKVYGSFWINKFNWHDQYCEVIMSGSDALTIGGIKPVDLGAKRKHSPSYKIAVFILLSGLALFILDIVFSGKWPKQIVDVLSFVSFLMFLLIGPAAIILTFFRKRVWTDPAVKLKNERDQKLAQHLAQRG